MRDIPEFFKNGYTLGGKVRVIDYYFNEGANRRYYHYPRDFVEMFINKAKDKKTLHYETTDPFLYEALDKHSIKGKTVLIQGSEEPCYEALAFLNGAESVTMVEYQKVTTDYPNFEIMTAEDFSESNGKYDCAFSISSVEHSGLGRYGDDLDPEGDLKAMDDLRSRLNSGGLCFLAVPMGEDCVFWNAHRQYGRVRFPMLIKGFEVIGEYGWQDSDFDILARKGLTKQPVIVLRKI